MSSSGQPSSSPTGPREEYQRRLSLLDRSLATLRRQDTFLMAAKVAVGLLSLVGGLWLAKIHSPHILAVFYPLAVFVLLFVIHERVLRRLRCCTRSQAFYQQGIDRLEDRWRGQGNRGERFLDPAHPYARDLDLFGEASLFELLSSARTRSGEETLASWLLAPATVAEALERQSAVRELTSALDLRERLALAGEELRLGSKPDSLLAWSSLSERAVPCVLQVLEGFLAAAWLFVVTGWLLWGWGRAALLLSLVNFAISYFTRARVVAAAEAAESATQEVSLLAAVFKVIEAGHLPSSRFAITPPAAAAFRRLGSRADWLASRHNLFVRTFDGFVFFTPLCVAALESWRDRHGRSVSEWITRLGEIEALSSLAGYAYEHPQNSWPQFAEDGPVFTAEALCHPLLPPAKAVPNDLKLSAPPQLVIISGPNMAGKSTFVRAAGLNAVLAQAGAPVPARSLTMSRLQVAASICILDSLQGGLSRFYAEIKRLKQVEELSRGSVPVLFLLDELLSGTNSHDRRLGTEAVLRTLLAHSAIGLVTTHDLALTRIAESWQGIAANAHFGDTLRDGELHFDYHLSPGVAHTTNALELMRSMGFDIPRS